MINRYYLYCHVGITGYYMKPQKERSDDVGPGRFGGISSSFHAHGKEGLLPVSDERGMVHQEPPECNQSDFSRDSSLVDHHDLLLV